MAHAAVVEVGEEEFAEGHVGGEGRGLGFGLGHRGPRVLMIGDWGGRGKD